MRASSRPMPDEAPVMRAVLRSAVGIQHQVFRILRDEICYHPNQQRLLRKSVAPPSRRLSGGRPRPASRARYALGTAGKMPALRSCLLRDRLERHLRSWASRTPLPLEKHRSVSLRNVIGAPDSKSARCTVDPARRPFDLSKITNGSFVEHHVAGAVTPLGAIFFIAESWLVSESAQDLVHLRAVLYRRLQLDSRLVPAIFILCLVR